MTEPQTSGTDTEWLPPIASAAVIGGIGAIAALAFSAVVAAGQGVLWPDEVDPAAFSGSWRIVAILTGAGLLVGVIHRLDPMARSRNSTTRALSGGGVGASTEPETAIERFRAAFTVPATGG